jgi:phosphoglycolate phosphatase-like HAD superfamily hydrolase
MSTWEPPKNIPLCIDLDGTLLRQDITQFAYKKIRARLPWTPFHLLKWGLQGGRPYIKDQIAQLTSVEDLALSHREINPAFHAYLREAHESGRYLVLATGAPQGLAQKVADYFGFFKEVIASTQNSNCVGKVKAQALMERFGPGQFAYAGNSWQDVPVWKAAAPTELIGVQCPLLLKTYLTYAFPHPMKFFE